MTLPNNSAQSPMPSGSDTSTAAPFEVLVKDGWWCVLACYLLFPCSLLIAVELALKLSFGFVRALWETTDVSGRIRY